MPAIVEEVLTGEEELLDALIEKLKDKPVYKTLKKIAKGKIGSVYEELKGWFSLGTHVAIELEHGHVEYLLILDMVHRKLSGLVNEVKKR